MVLPKVLSPSFWIDKCLTLVLQLVLALLLQILYILKGEDVRVTDVKVTVRKAVPSDGKSIIQSPAKATRPARQNITVKAGPNASIIASKKSSEEQIITGTLTELKPDKIEKIEAKAEISTSTATPIIEPETATVGVEKSEDIVAPKKKEFKAEEELVEVQVEEIEPEVIPEVKADEAEVSEIISKTVEEGSRIISEMAKEGSEIISEPVGVISEVKAEEVEVSEESSEVISKPIGVIQEVKAEEAEVSEEGSEVISESVSVVPEVKADEAEVSEIISEIISETIGVIPEIKADETEVSEIISEKVEEGSEGEDAAEDDTEDDTEVEIAQLPPLEMKTSHEVTHSDANVETVEIRWNHSGNKVFVTGDFDDWKVTHEMQRDYIKGGFVAFIKIDRTKKNEFKFVVDDNWCFNTDLPTKRDEHGNENNVIYPFSSGPLSHEYKGYPEISTSYQLAAAY